MNKTLLLLPAYGRRYLTLDQASADWVAGKDFKIFEGPYCSIRDVALIREQGYTHVALAYVSGLALHSHPVPL